MQHLLAVIAFLLLQSSNCSNIASLKYNIPSNYQPENYTSNHQKYNEEEKLMPKQTNHSNEYEFHQESGKNSSGGASNHKFEEESSQQAYEHHKQCIINFYQDHPSVPLTLGEEPRKQLHEDFPSTKETSKSLSHYIILIAKYSCLGFLNLMILLIAGVYYFIQNKKKTQRIVKEKVERERLQKFAFSEGPYLLSL